LTNGTEVQILRGVPKTNYPALVDWARIERGHHYQSPCLKKTLEAFRDNQDRILALSLMPGVVAAYALHNDPERQAGIKSPNALNIGMGAVEKYAEVIPAAQHGIKTLFSSVVIGAWTAFESLATDLWIESLNQRPTSLGATALKAQRRRNESEGEDESPEQKAQAGKAKPSVVSVDALAKYGFDLKNRIGYFLWRERRFNFNTLADLRRTYRFAFGPITEPWFDEPPFADLATLEAMRHVLTHRGGRVDENFMDRVRDHPELKNLKQDDHLELDGVIVARYAEAAIMAGGALAVHVDDWLIQNPE
jgi:hypothetical protein